MWSRQGFASHHIYCLYICIQAYININICFACCVCTWGGSRGLSGHGGAEYIDLSG